MIKPSPETLEAFKTCIEKAYLESPERVALKKECPRYFEIEEMPMRNIDEINARSKAMIEWIYGI